MESPSVNSFFGRHEFIIRRLHSLTGLFFVGGYLCFHLFTNAAVLDGAATYQRRADQIHAVGPTTLFFLEWCLVLLPILFHGLIGMVIVLRGKRNVWNYPYSGNIRYTLQRVTGVLAFAFILWHVFQMRGWCQIEWWMNHVTQAVGRRPVRSAQRRGHRGRGHPGVGAGRRGLRRRRAGRVFHLANGVWTMGATWGVWTSEAARRRANVPCTVVGLALLAIGVGALVGMLRVPLAAPSAHAAGLAALGAGAAMLFLRKGM